MKFLKQKLHPKESLLPKKFNNKILRKGLSDYGINIGIDNRSRKIACLACPEKFCLDFSENELKYNHIFLNVCPTKAISFSGNTSVIDYDNCMGCGLCAIRCPYGAIKFNDDYLPEINDLNYDYKKYSYSDFKKETKYLVVRNIIHDQDRKKLVKNLLHNLRDQKQNTIYPLVGSMLTSIGLATRITRVGDTNERTDSVIIDERNSIPIEIKSPTETEHIDIKSVRQALDNKIIMLSRNTHNTQFKTTSLSIGYRYPASRSDVDELIENIYEAYSINIGMIDFETLYVMLLNNSFKNVKITVNDIQELRGRL